MRTLVAKLDSNNAATQMTSEIYIPGLANSGYLWYTREFTKTSHWIQVCKTVAHSHIITNTNSMNWMPRDAVPIVDIAAAEDLSKGWFNE